MAAFGELGQWVEGDEITNAHAQRLAVGTGGAVGVQAQLHVVPADRHLVDGGVEGMPAGHQRQHAAAEHASVGEHTDPAALGKTARPAANRGQGQAAVILHLPHAGTDGVQVGGHGPVGRALPAFEGGADGATAGQLEGDAQFVQAFGYVAHDGVGEAGGAGDGEHLQQDAFEVVQIGFGVVMFRHMHSLPAFSQAHRSDNLWARACPAKRPSLIHANARLCGNSRSTKRSAVGCGSWLANPARSLASMIT
ncbi:hypothetical protein D3C76_679680 [compost metagenome]